MPKQDSLAEVPEGVRRGIRRMSAMAQVSPWQEFCDAAAVRPLALMLCADRVPIQSTHFKVL